MAQTTYSSSNNLTVKLWARKLSVEALKMTWWSKFMGNDTSSVIQILDNTQKSAGDSVTVGLRVQLSGNGIQGDGVLEGNEEALSTYSDQLAINQLRHAVQCGGRLSQQRVTFDIREEARLGLQDWWANRFDTSFFNQICGYTPQSNTALTGNNATTDATSNNIIRANSKATDATLTSTDTFTLALIDTAVEHSGTNSPMIRPIMIKGEAKYVAFLHDYQVTDLRTNSNTGQWLDIQKAAATGGQVSNNPIYTGALGEYNGVVLHKANRITQGVTSSTAITSTRRAVLCGAQACAIGFGRDNAPERLTWDEELFDYGNMFGVASGSIFGIKKLVFNSQDFSTMVMTSWAAAH